MSEASSILASRLSRNRLGREELRSLGQVTVQTNVIAHNILCGPLNRPHKKLHPRPAVRRWRLSVQCPSVRQSVPCFRFSRKRKAV